MEGKQHQQLAKWLCPCPVYNTIAETKKIYQIATTGKNKYNKI